MPERVRGRLDACLLGVLGDNLLDPPRAELAMPLGLEDPTVMRMGADMRSQSRGEALAEQNVAILLPFPKFTLILQASRSTSEIPKLQSSADPHRREERAA